MPALSWRAACRKFSQTVGWGHELPSKQVHGNWLQTRAVSISQCTYALTQQVPRTMVDQNIHGKYVGATPHVTQVLWTRPSWRALPGEPRSIRASAPGPLKSAAGSAPNKWLSARQRVRSVCLRLAAPPSSSTDAMTDSALGPSEQPGRDISTSGELDASGWSGVLSAMARRS